MKEVYIIWQWVIPINYFWGFFFHFDTWYHFDILLIPFFFIASVVEWICLFVIENSLCVCKLLSRAPSTFLIPILHSSSWSCLLDLLFSWSQMGFFSSLLYFANSCWWLLIYKRSMVNMKIFLQKIGPHFIIWYWLYVVDTMYMCILGCACVYLYVCVEGWIRGWWVVFITLFKKPWLKIIWNGKGFVFLFKKILETGY